MLYICILPTIIWYLSYQYMDGIFWYDDDTNIWEEVPPTSACSVVCYISCYAIRPRRPEGQTGGGGEAAGRGGDARRPEGQRARRAGASDAIMPGMTINRSRRPGGPERSGPRFPVGPRRFTPQGPVALLPIILFSAWNFSG